MFAKERRDALHALRQEQAKSEGLLLNILPRSIADQLKAQTQPIADHFGSASILFADVVDFTPWSERLTPAEVVEFFAQNYGPTTRAFATLGEVERSALRTDLVQLWTEHNQSGEPGRTVVDAEYLHVRAHRR